MALKPFEFHINQFRVGKVKELQFDQESSPWLQELLAELQEDVDPDQVESDQPSSYLRFKGEFERFNEGQFKDHMFLKGQVETCFYTLDIRTGDVISEQMELPIYCLILEASMVEELGFEEAGELQLNGIEWEIYPFRDQVFDLKEALHELLFLNKDPYPTRT